MDKRPQSVELTALVGAQNKDSKLTAQSQARLLVFGTHELLFCLKENRG